MISKILPLRVKIIFILLITTSAFINSNAQPVNALNFDGVDDYVKIGPGGPPGPTGMYPAGSSYTKEAWINYAGISAANYENIVSSWDAFWIDGGNLAASNNININANVQVRDPNPIVIGHWVHVAVTYDAGTTLLTLYKNGVLVDVNNGAPSVSTQMYIGAWHDGTSPVYTMNGSIDEVRIYNVALTAAQIQADMVSTASAVPGNLLAYYNFDIGSGTALADVTGNTINDGTLFNFALTGSTSNWLESYAMVLPTATAGTNITGTSFDANWTTPVIGTINNYIIDVAYDPGFTVLATGSPFTVPFGTNTLTITGLALNTNYYYRVSADKASVANQGAYSNTILVKTLTAPLPVKLNYFNGAKQGDKFSLNWQASCSNIKGAAFTIERSSDGRNFTSLYTITASTTRCQQPFEYLDNNPVAGKNFYRLKMVEDNDKISYSSIIILLNAQTGFDIIGLLPSVVKSTAVLNVTSAQKTKLNVVVTDFMGSKLQVQSYSLVAGSNQLEMNFDNFAPGAYQITGYTTLGQTATVRFVKQ
jgi:hypothetical protein